MSLIHAENWSIYGTSTTSQTNMAEGVYATVATGSSGVLCSTEYLRGLGTNCLQIGQVNTSDPQGIRWVNPDGAINEYIQGAAFYVEGLPPLNDELRFFQLRDIANAAQCTLWVTSTGVLQLRSGGLEGGTVLATSVTPIIVAGAYQFVELYVNIGNSGSAECRVDGVVAFSESGIDTQATANTGAASCCLPLRANTASTVGVQHFCMDWYICDTAGTVNNDFLGDTQWITVFPDADTAVNDWTPSTGSDNFAMVDEVPQDGDTTYTEAANALDVIEFDLGALPSGISEVIGVAVRPMSRKTSPGDGSLQASIVSGVSVESGVDRAMTEIYTYYSDNFDVDPATSARFSPAAFNAAKLRLERTA